MRTTQRRNKDGSVVRYYALAENARHAEKGHVEARVVHSFGRADKLDRAVLERLVAAGFAEVVLTGVNTGGKALEAATASARETSGLSTRPMRSARQ